MELTLEQINNILENLDPSHSSAVATAENTPDYDQTTRVFPTRVSGVFLKRITETDSYGGDDRLVSLKLVQPKPISAVEYE